MADSQNPNSNNSNYSDPYQPIDDQNYNNNNFGAQNPAQNDYQPFNDSYAAPQDPYTNTQPVDDSYTNTTFDQAPIPSNDNYDYTNTDMPNQPQDPYTAQNPSQQTSYDQNPTEFNNPPQTQVPTDNTFEQQKSGSKVFLIGSIVLAVILIAAVGVLLFITYRQDEAAKNSNTNNTAVVDDNKDNNTNTSNEEPTIDLASTGGNDSPATKSRVNSEAKLSTDWLSTNFTRSDVNAEGVCIAINRCGANADADKDGATNIQEYNFGTDPQEPDTDTDKIADGDELFIYFTDPKNAKSDTDEFADGAEISNCYDPIAVSTSRLSDSRIASISQNTSLKQIHEPTISYLKGLGATSDDISNKGLVFAKCPAAPTTTAPAATTTTQPQT